MPQVPGPELTAEVEGCASEIKALGLPWPRLFCFPHGEWDDRVVTALRSAGFMAAFTVRPAPLRRRLNPPVRGVIATAKGDKVDFVSRFFAPQSGINEDPVTGSAHTSLTPYWSKVLAKTELNARQLSPRTGALKCRVKGDRVEISGTCQPYLVGEIFLP
jgi:predicted PhzF superfamily epimerase YddE/YHI9